MTIDVEFVVPDLATGMKHARQAGADFFGVDPATVGVALVSAASEDVLLTGKVLSYRVRFTVSQQSSWRNEEL